MIFNSLRRVVSSITLITFAIVGNKALHYKHFQVYNHGVRFQITSLAYSDGRLVCGDFCYFVSVTIKNNGWVVFCLKKEAGLLWGWVLKGVVGKRGGAIFRVTMVYIYFFYRYLVAVFGSQNVYWLFPFISDTGTEPPESCIFGQMLNLGAVFSKLKTSLSIIYITLNTSIWWFSVFVIGCSFIVSLANYTAVPDSVN